MTEKVWAKPCWTERFILVTFCLSIKFSIFDLFAFKNGHKKEGTNSKSCTKGTIGVVGNMWVGPHLVKSQTRLLTSVYFCIILHVLKHRFLHPLYDRNLHIYPLEIHSVVENVSSVCIEAQHRKQCFSIQYMSASLWPHLWQLIIK